MSWLKIFGGKQEASDSRQIIVSVIESELEKIADALSRGRHYVDFRYKKGTAELFTEKDGVIARVTVYGENNTPDLIVVECNFSPEEQAFFAHYTQHIPDLRIKFRVLESHH